MSGVTCRSEMGTGGATSSVGRTQAAGPPLADALSPIRVTGGVAARFGMRAGRSVAMQLTESGGYRLAMPSTFAAHVEAAQINTGGGVAGGDRVATSISVASGADAVFATQGAERIYRSAGATARLDVALNVEAGARLDWLPQQTIVFAGARLARRIEADVAGDGRLLLVEVLTFGRAASAEGLGPAEISDQWRIRRDGRLVLAEAFRFSGEMGATMARAAVGGGARTSVIMAYLAPDGPDRLDAARLALAGTPCDFGVSTWNGLLVARLLARKPADAIAAVARLSTTLAGRAMPRVWSI